MCKDGIMLITNQKGKQWFYNFVEFTVEDDFFVFECNKCDAICCIDKMCDDEIKIIGAQFEREKN